MPSKRQRLENKQRNRKIKQYYQKKKDIENHKNNPKLQMETIKEFISLDMEKASISDIERLDADLDDFIKLLRQKTKQYEEIIEDDNAAYKYAYNYIIQDIIEKVNNMKYYNMYKHIEDKELKIPDWVFEGKEYHLIDKTINVEQVYSYWLNFYDFDLREIEQWGYSNLKVIDMKLIDYIEYYGLENASQFSKNWDAARKLAGDDIDAFEELKAIIQDEMMDDNNDPDLTYSRIEERFEDLKGKIFETSDKIRNDQATEETKHTNEDISENKLDEVTQADINKYNKL
ncbi:hypothetical protein [Staphylococcus pasteuri]|uniref:hypothetical protein n=1 Tax=Staphylococcus pasteuri TaxID=45972 RepID=UPI001E51A7FC|nr:hypothetical protein [Staphylococcus pasteuri]MCE3023116.1 hypothetical protein [Staphylococcus pasteuri]